MYNGQPVLSECSKIMSVRSSCESIQFVHNFIRLEFLNTYVNIRSDLLMHKQAKFIVKSKCFGIILMPLSHNL